MRRGRHNPAAVAGPEEFPFHRLAGDGVLACLNIPRLEIRPARLNVDSIANNCRTPAIIQRPTPHEATATGINDCDATPCEVIRKAILVFVLFFVEDCLVVVAVMAKGQHASILIGKPQLCPTTPRKVIRPTPRLFACLQIQANHTTIIFFAFL